MKKNKKSFADRARQIQRKYSNAANDKLEAESMELELQNLMQEQEAYKAANGLGTEETQNYGQGVPQFDGLGRSTFSPYANYKNLTYSSPNITTQPTIDAITGESLIANPYQEYANLLFNRVTNQQPWLQPYPSLVNNGQEASTQLSQPTGTSTTNSDQGSASNATTPPSTATRDNTSMTAVTPRPVGQLTNPMNTNLTIDKTMQDRLDNSELGKQLYNNQVNQSNKTSLAPSYISAGAGILGNLAQMAMDKRPNQIISPSYIPSRLDLTEEKIQADKQAQEAGNVARRNLRSGALSTGQMLSNLAGLESQIQKQRGQALTQLGTAEKQYNTGTLNQANQINAQQRAKDQLVNQQLSDAWKQRQRDYLSGAIGIIPQTMQDIRTIKAQDRLFNRQKAFEDKQLNAIDNWMRSYYVAPDGTVKARTK